jgi:hypothetical protein
MQSSRVGTTRLLIIAAACVVPAALAPAARAQSIDTYLPPDITGLGAAPGVTVASRLRPGYDPQGVHYGDWLITPTLTESFGYNSNVTGYSTGTGSAFEETRATANVTGRIGSDQPALATTADVVEYLGQARQSYTTATATLSDTHAFAGNAVTLAVSHLYLVQIASDYGALQTDAPVPYQVDDLRSFATLHFGRLTVTPQLDVQHTYYDNATILGRRVDLSGQERLVITGGAELAYSLTDQTSLVLVGEAFDNDYLNPDPTQPDATSQTGRILAGLDTVARGIWRLRLLAGLERRSFDVPQYRARLEPIVEGSLVWTPNGQTTASLTLTRSIEDPADNSVQGYTVTRAALVLDRELKRNLLLQGRLSYQSADPLQASPAQTNLLFGATLTRLINPNLRLTLSYDLDSQSGPSILLAPAPGLSTTRGGHFTRQVVSVGLRAAL